MHCFVLGSYMNANFIQLECLPCPGESLQAHGIFQEHGGKGLNLGIGLHRLGLNIRLLLGVGTDAAGKSVHEFLMAEGMDTDGVYYVGSNSGYGVGFIGANGENCLAAYHGANALITPEQAAQQLNNMSVLDWVCAQFETPDSVILYAFEIAKQRGATTYLNPSPWRLLPTQLLNLTDVLVVNANEAALMFMINDAATWDVATWLAQLPSLQQRNTWPLQQLIITLAEQGAISLSAAGELHYQPAWAITQIDATGAGDAFGCGLIYAWSQQLPTPQALQTANACGARVAASKGVLGALPNPAQLNEFMQCHAPPH